MPSIKNILIFVAIGAAFVLIYIFFIKPSPDEGALVSSSGDPVVSDDAVVDSANTGTTIDPNTTQEFLSLLLNVKSIQLDDSIFADPAFISLHDSSIVLLPDGKEGRINPFAPIGSDPVVTAPTCTLPKVLDTATNACVTPPTCTLPQVLNTTTNTCVNPSAN